EAAHGYRALFSGPIAVADVTGDRVPDVIGPNHWDGTVEVLPGDGKGGFGASVPSMVAFSQPEMFALGDLDGDGDLDEVVGYGNVAGNNLEWRKNDGAGHFGSPTLLNGGLFA